MKDLRELDAIRARHLEERLGGGVPNPEPQVGGVFILKVRGTALRIIASSSVGWDHVSVSLANRCPNWEEMEAVKRVFFRDEETAMQLHVPPAEHRNFHPFCLHLWRPHFQQIPRPDPILVAP